jgi:hypothetical protein
MAASVVQICNLALSHLGAAAIVSLTENSAEGIACNLHYETCRDSVLRDYPWNFATKRVALAELSETPPAGWSHVYSLPTDCLRAREIVNPAGTDPIKFLIESNAAGTARVLLTNQAQATLLYTAAVSEVTMFDPLFVDALAWKLASMVCIPLTRDRNIMQMCQTMYINVLAQAQTADANEGQVEPPREADWIAARGIGDTISWWS